MSLPASKISSSSDETQKELRIEKMHKLVEKSYNPFTPYSHRDFDLGFVRFWFNFVHKFDFTKLWEDGQKDLYNLDYFLQQTLFPRTLLERMEDKLQIRHTVREMGLDPDSDAKDFEDDYEDEIMDEARSLLPAMVSFDDDQKMISLRQYLKYTEEDEDSEGELEITFEKNQKVTLAGRIKSKRTSGKIAFATVEDEQNPEGFQFVFRQDVVGVSDEDFGKIHSSMSEKSLTFADLKEFIDEGDYIQAYGKLDYSQRGEPSLFVEYFRILTKALRPLPDTLEYDNVEARYLDRVADFKMNTKDEKGLSVRDMIKLKSKFWQIWREEMLSEGFLEIETPILRTNPSGAESKPFTTFYNELDQEVYLRMELELYQKRMIAGGFEKIFEIGRQFRNEGSSPQHLQEYTQLEWYAAYKDYEYGMEFMKKVFQRLVREILGFDIQTDYYGNQINWGDWCGEKDAKKNNWQMISGWPKIPYYDAFRYYSEGKIDIENKTIEELVELGTLSGVENLSVDLGMATVMDKIWKKVRVKVTNPIFLILPPVELEPLAKRNPANPKLTERFQLVAGGNELGKGFSELNDPIDQMGRFEEQQKAHDNGNEEAMVLDGDYVKALEYGTPPMAGWGSSERLFSFLLGKHIKECVTFPIVRSNQQGKPPKKRTKVAHILLLNKSDFPLWQKLNAASHLAASLGAREGEKLFTHKEQLTKESETIQMNIGHAIILKQTDNKMDILELKRKAEKEDLTVTTFTRDMLSTTDDYKLEGIHGRQKAADIEWLGVLVFGPKKEVETLTDGFELMG
jgi:lysyl-tRNA synthetase class 2